MQPMGQSRFWHHRHRTMAMQSCGIIRSSMYAYHSLVTYGSSMDLSFHGASENSVMRTAYRLESLDGHCNNPVDNTKADRGDFATFEGKKNSYARATPHGACSQIISIHGVASAAVKCTAYFDGYLFCRRAQGQARLD